MRASRQKGSAKARASTLPQPLGLSRQLDELISLGNALRRLEAMIDRQYIGLLLHLANHHEGDAGVRSASALRRYQAWRRAVEDRLLEASEEWT